MYLGVSDLVARWVYTRGGVHVLLKNKAFPAPCFIINKGRTKVFLLADIEAYEKNHPELFDDEIKRRKQNGYYLACGRERAVGKKE